jgi:hypothetical protein
MLLLPDAYLAKKLTKPLPIKAGGGLRTGNVDRARIS